MAQELRRIILNKEELISALEAHRRMNPHFLPAGKITDFKSIDQSSIVVSISDVASVRTASIVFKDSQLFQPVLRFCIENNILLPREGHKSILVYEDKVSLCVVLDINSCGGEGEGEPMRFSAQAAAN